MKSEPRRSYKLGSYKHKSVHLPLIIYSKFSPSPVFQFCPQVIHQQGLVKKAIQQVKDNESSDEDTMYMGCDDDGYVEAV